MTPKYIAIQHNVNEPDKYWVLDEDQLLADAKIWSDGKQRMKEWLESDEQKVEFYIRGEFHVMTYIKAELED